MYFENSWDRLPNKYFFIRSSCENMISEEYFVHMFNEEEFGRFLQSFFFQDINNHGVPLGFHFLSNMGILNPQGCSAMQGKALSVTSGIRKRS